MISSPIKIPKGRILVVDDDPDDLHLIATMLTRQGYEVCLADNASIALSTLTTELPDLVLLDIMMSGMDGYEVSQILKSQEHTRNIPIIFVSAHHQLEEKLKAFKSGGVDYISKPFQIEELLTRIESHLMLQKIQLQLRQTFPPPKEHNSGALNGTSTTRQIFNFATTLGDLASDSFQVAAHVPSRIILETFKEQPSLPGVLVQEQGQPLAMISRRRFFEHISRPYGIETFGRRPIRVFLESIALTEQEAGLDGSSQNFIRLPTDYPIQQAVEIALSRPEPKTYEPIVLELANGEYRLLAMNTLLVAYSHLFAASNQTLQEADTELQLLLSITQAISAAPDFDSALSVALRSLGETTRWTYGEAWIESADGSGLECSRSWYYNLASLDLATASALEEFRRYSEALTFLPDEELPGRAWVRQQPEWIIDFSEPAEDIFMRFDMARGCGLKASFAVPIITPPNLYNLNARPGDQVLAVLVFFMTEVRPQDERLARLVSAVAAQLGKVLAQKRTEAEMRALFAAMTDMVLVRDASGRCQKIVTTSHVNPVYLAENILGKTFHEVLPKVQADYLLSCLHQSLKTQKTVYAEYPVTIDQKSAWLSATISPLTENTVIVVVRDISDRKQTEEALRQSEAHNRAVITAIPDLLIRISREGFYLDYIAAKDAVGVTVSADERIGKHITEVLPPAQAAEQLDYINRALETGECQVFEQKFWFRSQSYDEEVRIVVSGPDEVLLIVRDITERKRLEGDLAQASRFLNSIVENIPLALFLKDVNDDFRYVLWNQTAEQIYGIPREEVLGRNLYDLVSRDLADQLQIEHQQLIEQRTLVIQDEIFESGFRQPILQQIRKLPLINEQDQVTHLMYIAEDVSERRRMEEALRKAEENYRSIFENAVEGIYQATPDGQYLSANLALAKIYGYESPEALKEHMVDIERQLYVNPGDRQRFITELDRNDQLSDFEYQIRCKNGSIIWISENARAVRDETGQLLYYEGIISDITRRHSAEEALRANERQLRNQNRVLMKLTKNRVLNQGNLLIAAKVLTASLTNTLGVQRASVWLHDEKSSNKLICLDLYERSSRQHTQGMELLEEDCPNYFQTLRSNEVIVASDACHDPLTREFATSYFAPAGIVSTLDVPIRSSSKTVGVFCVEQLHTPRHWTPEEESFARSIADLMSLAIEARDRKRAEAALQWEKQKSEQLLLNILPAPIAQRLKRNSSSIAEHFEEVTILFADIVGFTALSSQLQPIELVELLNRIFSTFDELADQYKLEKIKTIGDAYMVAAGLPIPRADHAEAMADMALAMQAAAQEFRTPDGEKIHLRIGINTGVVVAGVIGRKKFIYDLWGDAVNIASRMESSGEPGAIQVTTPTYERLKSKYIFEKRGAIHIKGKGNMVTYWLIGQHPEFLH